MTRGRAEFHDRRRYLAQGAYRVPMSGLRCDTADEHQRFDEATRDLRNDARPVEVYEITTLGRGALAVAEWSTASTTNGISNWLSWIDEKA